MKNLGNIFIALHYISYILNACSYLFNYIEIINYNATNDNKFCKQEKMWQTRGENVYDIENNWLIPRIYIEILPINEENTIQ